MPLWVTNLALCEYPTQLNYSSPGHSAGGPTLLYNGAVDSRLEILKRSGTMPIPSNLSSCWGKQVGLFLEDWTPH